MVRRNRRYIAWQLLPVLSHTISDLLTLEIAIKHRHASCFFVAAYTRWDDEHTPFDK